MEKLKPCPFCGSEADYYVGYIQCVHCLANIPYRYGLSYADGKAEAIEAWNRRAAPENKPLTLEELRKMDGLVMAGTIKDDSQRYVRSIANRFGVDRKNPRVEIQVEEVRE